MLSLADVALAEWRLRPYLTPTPLEAADDLGPAVILKLENANRTHSFKVRGALNALLALGPSARGVVTASTGNHAQGLAYAARLAGRPAVIVMPRGTPTRKVEHTRRHGAEIVIHGDDFDAAEAHAQHLAQAQGLTYISAYNDPPVIAGQGTIGLELMAARPDLERVVIPVSGGGLLSGIALACKSLKPSVEVIGVQSVATAAMHNLFYGTDYPQAPSLAEALAGGIEDGSITIELAKAYTDRIVLVEEEAIAEAIRWMLREQGWLVEGAGAVGVAALQTGAVPPDHRPTAVIISGGNIDYQRVQQLVALSAKATP